MTAPDWDAVYVQMRPRVLSVVRSVLRDEHEAEDAVQDTFLRAFRGIGSLRDARALPAWILSIARHSAISRGRKLVGKMLVDENTPEPLDRREAEPPDATEVAEAYARLSPGARRLLDRRASGWTLKQIATEEQVSIEAAKMRLHRARVRLKAALS